MQTIHSQKVPDIIKTEMALAFKSKINDCQHEGDTQYPPTRVFELAWQQKFCVFHSRKILGLIPMNLTLQKYNKTLQKASINYKKQDINCILWLTFFVLSF